MTTAEVFTLGFTTGCVFSAVVSLAIGWWARR